MQVPFKPFEQMTAVDYAALGLRVGLEVHQQLRTRRKLFCRCPAGRYSDDYDAEILRHMRPTLSELGQYDGTALMEKKTRKNIHYRIHHETVCTYEFDDTPPFFIDDEALDTAIEIALLLRLNLVGELHVARKQYLDGSIPAGFQRTGILGVDGWIPYQDRRIRIRQLSIEEDACREVSDIGHNRVYLTDRLGTPLVEMVTEPDLHTPQEAAEVGQILRMLTRSTGRVRTGYGAARQDVNVSIDGGTRVEIKGTPQIWRNPRLIYNEARRQFSLLRIRDELRDRGVRPETFQFACEDVTKVFATSSCVPFRVALAGNEVVRCIRLAGFAGLLNAPTQECATFASEFSDRVRVIACLMRRPNLIHSDDTAGMLSEGEWKQVRQIMRADDRDALLLVWGSPDDARCAADEIVVRAREATEGVPSDTRQAHDDGTNGFERVLPGAERMYPDTDLPPVEITPQRIERIQVRQPEFVWKRQARYRALGVPADLIQSLCLSRRADLFDRLVGQLEVDPTFAAVILVERLTAFRREGLPVNALTDEMIQEVFRVQAERQVAREGVIPALRALARLEPSSDPIDTVVKRTLHTLGLTPAMEDEVRRDLEQQATHLDGSRFASRAQQCKYLIGVLGLTYRGRMEGRRLAALVHEHLGLPLEGRAAVGTRE